MPDPVAERKRKRVILKGDVPSPVNPPPGCRFHTRCWLYERLGQPENCRTIDPPLAPVADVTDHEAACHYADEALKTDVGIAHIDQNQVRRGTPASALASLLAEKGTTEHEQVLAAPAFADTPEATEERQRVGRVRCRGPRLDRHTDGPPRTRLRFRPRSGAQEPPRPPGRRNRRGIPRLAEVAGAQVVAAAAR